MSQQHFLSFVTNFKNEQAYLKEWLDYHIQVGVDHFYLFNQDGSEESRKILAPYEQAGYVTQHIWTHFGAEYEGPTYFFQKNKIHFIIIIFFNIPPIDFLQIFMNISFSINQLGYKLSLNESI